MYTQAQRAQRLLLSITQSELYGYNPVASQIAATANKNTRLTSVKCVFLGRT